MKKILYTIAGLIFSNMLVAQVLEVKELTQEHDQWCWAGVSACAMDYYGLDYAQCEIVEYARTHSTEIDFGQTNCCENPNLGCNNWNYLYDYDGDIQDILSQMGQIESKANALPLTKAVIRTNLENNLLFVIRWGWVAGGGHFMLGHGLQGNNLYYMDPWPGEGFKISDYDWVKENDEHKWTHTLRISKAPVAVAEAEKNNILSLYPNPVLEDLTINLTNISTSATYELKNAMGQTLLQGRLSDRENRISMTSLAAGIYFIRVHAEEASFLSKIIKITN